MARIQKLTTDAPFWAEQYILVTGSAKGQTTGPHASGFTFVVGPNDDAQDIMCSAKDLADARDIAIVYVHESSGVVL